MTLSTPPIFEMSMSVHWHSEAWLRMPEVLAFDRALGPDYQLTEAVPAVQPEGVPFLEFAANDLPARWFYTNPPGDMLVQLQRNMLALNWRNRRPLEDRQPSTYPGYVGMSEAFPRAWNALVSVHEEMGRDIPEPTSVALLYDNIWLLPEMPGKVSDVFSFWASLGLKKPILGPEIKFSVLLDMATAPGARVDVNSSLGNVQVGEGVRRAARIHMNGVAPSSGIGTTSPATFDLLHDFVSDLFRRLVTSQAREGWL